MVCDTVGLSCHEHAYFLQIHTDEHDTGGQTESSPGSAGSQPTWVNSLVGRIFWDFLQDRYWTDQVAQKIQKKLSKIKVKYVHA